MNTYYYLTSTEITALKNWHNWLDNSLGDRSRLRRGERAEDILLTDAFFNFQSRMPECWRENKPIFSSAAVAGLLSHVEVDKQDLSKVYQSSFNDKQGKPASFAEQLATPIKGGKPPMSELRFQRLLKSRTTDEFYLGILRAIRLLNKELNLISLANDIIHWHKEYKTQISREPTSRLAVCWATDYFTALENNK